MQNQIYPYLNQIFSKYQCGFRKGFNVQHCLMAMIEEWCQSLNTGGHADMRSSLTNHELLTKRFETKRLWF